MKLTRIAGYLLWKHGHSSLPGMMLHPLGLQKHLFLLLITIRENFPHIYTNFIDSSSLLLMQNGALFWAAFPPTDLQMGMSAAMLKEKSQHMSLFDTDVAKSVWNGKLPLALSFVSDETAELKKDEYFAKPILVCICPVRNLETLAYNRSRSRQRGNPTCPSWQSDCGLYLKVCFRTQMIIAPYGMSTIMNH